MKEFLKNNLTLKIFSIIFAIFLWFAINPVQTNSYTVPLNVINEDSLKANGLVLTNKNYQKYVVVSVKERGNVLDAIKDRDFEVTLDLSQVKSINDKVVKIGQPVYLGREKLSSNSIDMKPKTITLDLAKIEENPFNVQIETYGKLPAGYEIISKTATPETVSIQAVDSVINSVGSVKVFVDVTNLNKTLEIKKECKVYNKKGEEMPELAKKLFADVKIEVGKRVPVIPIIQGKPAKDFVDGEFTVKPDKILIMGDAQIMAKTNELRTQPIDITNAMAPINIPVLIVVPDGLKLVSSSREVIVTVDISALEERVFEIPTENISIEGNPADVTFSREITSPTSIKLKGKKYDLDKLTVTDFAASVDITGLNEGTHNIPIKVTLPETVSMVEETLVQVKIKKGA